MLKSLLKKQTNSHIVAYFLFKNIKNIVRNFEGSIILPVLLIYCLDWVAVTLGGVHTAIKSW